MSFEACALFLCLEMGANSVGHNCTAFFEQKFWRQKVHFFISKRGRSVGRRPNVLKYPGKIFRGRQAQRCQTFLDVGNWDGLVI